MLENNNAKRAGNTLPSEGHSAEESEKEFIALSVSNKQNIIFLPGMMCDERVFTPQIKHLEKRFNYLIGNMHKHDNLPQMASEIIADSAFDEFFLCGLSMGGILAMEILQQAPKKVKGLILIDTNHLADNDERKIGRNAQIKEVEQGHLDRIMRDDMKPFYLCEENKQKEQEMMNLFFAMALELGEKVFISQSLALRDRESYEPTLKEHPKPALIICGREDALCTPQRHEMIHALIPHSTLHILERCGHISNLEQPQKVNALIDEWLKTI